MTIEEKKHPIPVTKSQLTHHWQQRLNGNNLTEMKMRYKDADYFLRHDPDLDPETLIYEHIVKESDAEEGHLNWGHITLYPGMIKDQYFCTKGYYHMHPGAEEYLLCMQGEGLIMLMSRSGECWCEELEEGSLHKVPADTARRIINIGDVPLMLSECVPADAGIDFDAIDEQPFPCHVYDDNGEMAMTVDIDEDDHPADAMQESDILALLKMDDPLEEDASESA